MTDEQKVSVRVFRATEQIAAIRREQERVSAFAGLRFGVQARLRELARDERRLIRRLEALTAQQATFRAPGREAGR